MLTVHHGEAVRDRFWAEPGKTCVDVVGFFVFPRPIPNDIGLVIGVERWM